MKGIRDHHYRDFWSYIKFNQLVNKPDWPYFCPDGGEHFEQGEQDTVKCFVNFDARGKKEVYPKDPELLKLAVDGKKLVNFHIKMWAEGLEEGTLFAHEIMYELFDLPDWVCESLVGQIWKIREEKYKCLRPMQE